MATIAEEETWDNGVYQLETTDPVQGGVDGVDNVPHKALANRTLWLKAQVALKALLGGSANQLFKVKAGVAADEAVNKLQLETATANVVTGYKNILINTELRVNQRVYDNSSVADGVYTYDRFKAIGGNATISSTGLITGIIAQVIEAQNIISGDYTFSNALCDVTIAGVTKTTPCTFSIVVGSDIEVRFSNGNIKNIQMEAGTKTTNKELRTIGLELSLCQRYFEKSYNPDVPFGTITYEGSTAIYNYQNVTATNNYMSITAHMKVTKRVLPTVVIYSPVSGLANKAYGSSGDCNIGGTWLGMNTIKVSGSAVGINSNSNELAFHFTADSEI